MLTVIAMVAIVALALFGLAAQFSYGLAKRKKVETTFKSFFIRTLVWVAGFAGAALSLVVSLPVLAMVITAMAGFITYAAIKADVTAIKAKYPQEVGPS
jgi:hypothetical protein